MSINTGRLSAMIRARRGRTGLRDAAKEIGDVSPSTLSRVEQGKVPDLDTYIRLCRWLNVPQEEFVDEGSGEKAQANEVSTAVQVELHLRANSALDSKTVEALVTMVRLACEAAERGNLKGEEDT